MLGQSHRPDIKYVVGEKCQSESGLAQEGGEATEYKRFGILTFPCTVMITVPNVE